MYITMSNSYAISALDLSWEFFFFTQAQCQSQFRMSEWVDPFSVIEFCFLLIVYLGKATLDKVHATSPAT